MSSVLTVPEFMHAAATNLATIESTVDAAATAAAAPTSGLLPAAADEVSAGIAQVFSQHAAEYQNLAKQATTFHRQFTQQLTAAANAYTGAEAANTGSLQPNPASAAPAATGIPWWDSLEIAINGSISYAVNRIVRVLFLPFWFPIALSYLPVYTVLAAAFPEIFPLSDFWKIFFLPIL